MKKFSREQKQEIVAALVLGFAVMLSLSYSL